MSPPPLTSNTLRVSELSQLSATSFNLRPTSLRLAEIRSQLGLIGLRKLSFHGFLDTHGKSDWTLKAQLGATIGQSCVVTLETVTTRLDLPVNRLLLAVMPSIESQAELGDEIQMPDDETIEPLGKIIDLEAIMIEALAIAIPEYPKIPNANLATSVFTQPGHHAMTDDDTLPFAGLATLRATIGGERDDEPDDGSGNEPGNEPDEIA